MASYKFLKSNEVKVFPCAYRDPEKATETGWEANLATEFNLVHDSGFKGGRESYIISKDPSAENATTQVCCVIKGYYFELTIPVADLTDSNYQYAYIKLADVELVSTTAGAKKSTVLVDLESEVNDIVLDDDSGYFKGIGFTKDKLENLAEGITCLSLIAGSSKFALSEDNIEGKTRDANKVHIDSGDSIYNNFLTQNAIITDSFRADGATNIIGGSNAKLEVKNGASKQVVITAPNTDISGELHVKDINYPDNNGEHEYTSIKLYDAEYEQSAIDIYSQHLKDQNKIIKAYINNVDNVDYEHALYIQNEYSDINPTTIYNSTTIKLDPYNAMLSLSSSSGNGTESAYLNLQDGITEIGSSLNGVTGNANIYLGYETAGDNKNSKINLTANKVYINGSTFTKDSGMPALQVGGCKINNTAGQIDAKAVVLISATATDKLLQVGTSSTVIKFNVTANGDVTAQTYTAESDLRLKENIEDYIPEKSILDLPIKKFDFISGKKNNIGCIAQELQEICPEIVHEGFNGYLGIEENKLVYLLLYEVKKLKEEIDKLKGE